MSSRGAPLLALFAACSVTVACGGTTRSRCEVAQDKLSDCATAITTAAQQQGYVRMPLTIDDDCSGRNECFATCVNAADCPALARALGGGGPAAGPPPPGADTLQQCITACYDL